MADDKKAKWSLADLPIPILASALSLYYLSTIQGIPFIAKMYGGGLSILILVLSAGVTLYILIKEILAKKTIATHFTSSNIKEWFVRYRKAFGLILFIALFIILIRFIGYTLVSILFISSTVVLLGARDKKQVITMAIGVTVIGFLLFILFLKVSLPLDPLSFWLKRLVM